MKTDTEKLNAQLEHLLPEELPGWNGYHSYDYSIVEGIRAANNLGINLGKPLADSLAELETITDHCNARVEKYQISELTEADLDAKDAHARITKQRNNRAALPIAINLRVSAVKEASANVRAVAKESANEWLAALNDLYVAEHDGLYLADENNLDEPPRVGLKRKQRREDLDTAYAKIRSCAGLGTISASSREGLFAGYEITVAQWIAVAGEESPDSDTPESLAIAHIAARLGVKPRLYLGTAEEFRNEIDMYERVESGARKLAIQAKPRGHVWANTEETLAAYERMLKNPRLGQIDDGGAGEVARQVAENMRIYQQNLQTAREAQQQAEAKKGVSVH